MEEPPLRDLLRTSELPPVAASVRAARHELLPLLEGVFTADERDVAALLVSELVANAILHADAPISFTASLTPECLRVEVCDASTTLPRVREPDADSQGGWGLCVVSDLASRWGAEPTDDGKRVWFELDRLPTPETG
jgi:anti-sigma regulatory factor (Ser/Thr protein kinase)